METMLMSIAAAAIMTFMASQDLAQDPNSHAAITNKTMVSDPNDLWSLFAKAHIGDAEAQYRVGLLYDKPHSTQEDHKKAIEWYTKAAVQGFAEAQYNLGLMYYNGQGLPQDYKEAFILFSKAAEQGLANAQGVLGVMYAKGQGIHQDYREAVKWYTKAAEQGEIAAQFSLAIIYDFGKGGVVDYRKAAYWYTKAAEQGFAPAQCRLGIMYENGWEGLPLNIRESIKWYTKAAEQGFALAQCNLGVKYIKGEGVPEDFKEAAHWFTKAAEQGDAQAQYNLGLMYISGKGVIEDYIEAYKWLLLAGMNGIDVLVQKDYLQEKMESGQIAEAQRRAKNFRPKAQESDTKSSQISEKSEIKRIGTGFFITSDGYLLTACHVVSEASKIQVLTGTGLYPAKVVRLDSANDMALLKVDGQGFEALAVQTSRAVKAGQEIFTLGFPNIQFQGTEAKYTQGNISSLSGIADDPRLFQISAAVQPGNSGGPLLDADGMVVGLVVAKLDDIATAIETGSLPQNVNYALKSSFILSFLESVPAINDKLLQPKKSELTRTQVVEKTSKAVVMVQCY